MILVIPAAGAGLTLARLEVVSGFRHFLLLREATCVVSRDSAAQVGLGWVAIPNGNWLGR